MLECGHVIRESTRSRYIGYKYKNTVKTMCEDCDKLSTILRAGCSREMRVK